MAAHVLCTEKARIRVGITAAPFVTATGYRGSHQCKYLGIADGRTSGQVTSVEAVLFSWQQSNGEEVVPRPNLSNRMRLSPARIHQKILQLGLLRDSTHGSLTVESLGIFTLKAPSSTERSPVLTIQGGPYFAIYFSGVVSASL
jgi:hypothetical protein